MAVFADKLNPVEKVTAQKTSRRAADNTLLFHTPKSYWPKDQHPADEISD
jgi:hypothetical protein